jgi:hypothetical protein
MQSRICSDMTGEHDTRNKNPMEGRSQYQTSPEDGLLLGRNAYRREKENCACKLGNYIIYILLTRTVRET